MKSLRAWVLACAVAAGAAIAGCGGAGGITTSVAPTTNNTAVVRFVNGSPDNGAVDVYINGVAVYSDVQYGTVTPYYLLKSGVATTVDVYAYGSVSPDIVPKQTVTLTNSQAESIALVGHKAAPATLTTQTFLEKTYTTTISQFGVSFHHASPAGPATLFFGAFTPSPVVTPSATAAATATAVATATSLVTPVPSIAPFPYPSAGTSFQVLTTAGVTYAGTNAASTNNVAVVQGIGAGIQTGAFFATSVSAPSTSYCIYPVTCAVQLQQNNILSPYDYDPTDVLNTIPDGANYHMSIFAIDSTPPYAYQLAGGFD
jgi:hypothetical protein